MAQTLRDVAVELELFEYSQAYMDLLKEEAEIDLCDQYVAMQEGLMEITGVRSYLTEGYLMTEASTAQVEEVKEKNEQRKKAFLGKVTNVLLKAYRFVVKFLQRISDAWMRLKDQRKDIVKSIMAANEGNPFDEIAVQSYLDSYRHAANQLHVHPHGEQPAQKLLEKKIKFGSSISVPLRTEFLQYLAFGVGDIIVIKSNGSEVQMDNGLRLQRMEGVANDKVDDTANEAAVEAMREQAKKAGIRVNIDGEHFTKVRNYYKNMADKYVDKSNKYTVDQNTKEIAANLNDNEQAKENAAKKKDQMTGRSKACAEIAAALSATCELINKAYQYQNFMAAEWGVRGSNAKGVTTAPSEDGSDTKDPVIAPPDTYRDSAPNKKDQEKEKGEKET